MDDIHIRLLRGALYKSCGRVILAVDPGDTVGLAWTGVALKDGEPVAGITTRSIPKADFIEYMKELVIWEYSEDTASMPWNEFQYRLDLPRPDQLVVESWRLYATNAKAFINSSFPEPRLIGRIEMITDLLNIPIHMQPASMMKSLPWCEIGSNAHEKDAAKHLVRYLLDQSSEAGHIQIEGR